MSYLCSLQSYCAYFECIWVKQGAIYIILGFHEAVILHWMSAVFDTLFALQSFLPIAVSHCFKFVCTVTGLRCPDEMGSWDAEPSQAGFHPGIRVEPPGLFPAGPRVIEGHLTGPCELVRFTAWDLYQTKLPLWQCLPFCWQNNVYWALQNTWGNPARAN